MARKEAEHPLPVEKRREIFLTVAQAQDEGQSVEQARHATAKKYAVTEAQVKAIEAEGADNDWPPLA